MFGRFTKRDLLYMAISLFFAVVLWIYVLNAENPSREKIVRQVQIVFSGEDKLSSNQNLMIKGDRAEYPSEATVVVSVPASKYADVTNETVKATIDLSQITESGEHTVDISAAVSGVSGVSILSVSPSKVTIEVDEIRQRNIPIEIQFEGEVPQGYWFSGTTVTPSTLTLSGPYSELSQIDKAVCKIDRSILTQSLYDSMSVTLFDAEGQVIDGSDLSGDLLYTTVQIDVLPTKTVPINITSALMGKDDLADGYQLVNATVNPAASATIAAEQEVLNTISELYIYPINLSGMSESTLLYDVELQLPNDVMLLSNNQYNVFIEIEEKYISKDYFDIPIEIRNQPDRLDAELSASSGKVTLTAQISALADFSQKNLKLYVDASGLEAGEHELAVHIETGDDYSLISSVYWPGAVTLTLTEPLSTKQ